MERITEDYVSFEVAKLLKEKGFDEACWSWYHNVNNTRTGTSRYRNSELERYDFSKPTLAHVMKWLRIEHNIHIEPHIVRTKRSYGYMPNYININDLTQHFPFKEIDFCDLEKYVCMTYDKACEVAIKYCLENLI